MTTHDDQSSGAGAAVSTAKDEAAGLAQSAADSGQDLLHSAKDQAADVVSDAKDQARDLLGEARSSLTEQASAQQGRLAQQLRTFGDELGRMAQSSEESGTATDLVQRLAGHTGTVATWLEDREPGTVLQDVSDFARRRPGLFLGIAAGAGLLVGRLTRGMKDASGSDGGTSSDATTGSGSGSGNRASHRAAGAPTTPVLPDPVDSLGFADADDDAFPSVYTTQSTVADPLTTDEPAPFLADESTDELDQPDDATTYPDDDPLTGYGRRDQP